MVQLERTAVRCILIMDAGMISTVKIQMAISVKYLEVGCTNY